MSTNAATLTSPARFYDGQPLESCRKILRESCGDSGILGFTLNQAIDTETGRKISIAQIFDRRPAWIRPRLSRCYINENRRVAVADAACYLDDACAYLQPHLKAIHGATVNPQRLDLPAFNR